MLVSTLDYETIPNYVLEVTAIDNGSPTLSTTITLSIAVTNVDDLAPVCASSLYSVTLAEDSVPGVVVTVTCTDGDTVVSSVAH